MMMFTKREFKLFLTFFIIYVYFVHWPGWNENSRFDLTRAIVEEGRLTIDSYYNDTTDRSFYNGHYYSDKAPGLSFLSVPIYATWKFLYYNLFPAGFVESNSGHESGFVIYAGPKNVPIRHYYDPGFFILMSKLLVTAFTSGILTALTVVLVYRSARLFEANEYQSLMVAGTYGLGTLAFSYAIVFLGHNVGAFFSFLGFYLLIKARRMGGERLYSLSGLALGLAVVFEVPTVIVMFLCLALVISRKDSKKVSFVVGIIVGVAPLLIYNYLIFQNPFVLPRMHTDPDIWIFLQDSKWITDFNPTNTLNIVLRLLIYPYRGILFYYPVLLLSLIGLAYMYKSSKGEALIILGFSVLLLIFVSNWWSWWGGTYFGARHLSSLMPFLAVPMAFAIRRFNRIFLLLALVSIAINVMGLQIGEDIIDSNLEMDPYYKQKQENFQIISNPIIQHYLPLTISNGPRSRLFENIIDEKKLPLDIRDTRYSRDAHAYIHGNEYLHIGSISPLGMIVLRVPFLSLVLLMILLLLLWWNEISKKIKQKRRVIVLLALLFIILFVRAKGTIYDDNWWPKVKHEDVRWMSQNATVSFFNSDADSLKRFSLTLESFHKNRNLSIYLNDELVDQIVVDNFTIGYSAPLINVPSGINSIRFFSEDGCDIASTVKGGTDIRCLSFGFKNISITKLNTGDLFFNNNWWLKVKHEDVRWMSQNATVSFFNIEDSDALVKFYFDVRSFYKKRNMSVYLNDELIDQIAADTITTLYPPIEGLISPGMNSLRFYSEEGCDVVSDVEIWDDIRCLSFGFKNLSVVNINPEERY